MKYDVTLSHKEAASLLKAFCYCWSSPKGQYYLLCPRQPLDCKEVSCVCNWGYLLFSTYASLKSCQITDISLKS